MQMLWFLQKYHAFSFSLNADTPHIILKREKESQQEKHLIRQEFDPSVQEFKPTWTLKSICI